MRFGEITKQEYNISIKYSEFADDSFENKIETLGKAFDNGIISEEMYITRLYGDNLTHSEKEKELKWLKEHHTDARELGMQGILGANTPTINVNGDNYGNEEEFI